MASSQGSLFDVGGLHYKWVGEEWGPLLNQPFAYLVEQVFPKIAQAKASGTIVYPATADVFNAYKLAPDKAKVVILGQDPYHDGSAHGFAFSTLGKVTPSLRVVFKELANCGYPRTNPNLLDWVDQGVFLLNTVLTVEKGKPASHKSFGWQTLTDATIRILLETPGARVFMLWGNDAQATFDRVSKGLQISSDKLVIRLAHPQAENYSGGKSGYLGSRCFELTNQFLINHALTPIQW